MVVLNNTVLPYGAAGLLGQPAATAQNTYGWHTFERQQREELYRQTGVAQHIAEEIACGQRSTVLGSAPVNNELLLLLDD